MHLGSLKRKKKLEKQHRKYRSTVDDIKKASAACLF
jgi:hypothetical protein